MAGKRGFFSRLFKALSGGDKPKEIIPETPRPTVPTPPPPPPPREPETPYVSESDDSERVATRLVRLYIQNQSGRYRRRGVKENKVRERVDNMPPDILEKAKRISGSKAIEYARDQNPQTAVYPEHFDDEGNNYFWYH